MTDDELVGILRVSDRPDVRYAADRIEALGHENRELRAALKQVRTVVRPWIDGGATFHEWRVAVDSIDAALARYPEDLGQDGLTKLEAESIRNHAMISEGRFLNPPKCRKCGHVICPTVWACSNPRCPKNRPKTRKAKAVLHD